MNQALTESVAGADSLPYWYMAFRRQCIKQDGVAAEE